MYSQIFFSTIVRNFKNNTYLCVEVGRDGAKRRVAPVQFCVHVVLI